MARLDGRYARGSRAWGSYDLLPERIAVFSDRGSLLFANAAWRAASGDDAAPLLAARDLRAFAERVLAASASSSPSWSALAHEFERLLSGETSEFDHECVSASASGRTLACRVRAARHPAGRSVVLVVLHQDLSGLRHAELEFRRAISDRDTLLREVHHRVKNNLQVISSLLALQVRTLESEAARTALTDTRMRVRAIAAVHERLCESDDLACLDLGEYLRALVPSIASSSCSGGFVPRLDLDVASIPIGLDDAVRCGLMVNELVINAMKHAFTGRHEGAVSVSLCRSDAEHAVLSVADDGVGLPMHIDPARAESLGLHLASGLAQRLGGSIHVDRGRGTAFRIVLRTPVGTP